MISVPSATYGQLRMPLLLRTIVFLNSACCFQFKPRFFKSNAQWLCMAWGKVHARRYQYIQHRYYQSKIYMC